MVPSDPPAPHQQPARNVLEPVTPTSFSIRNVATSTPDPGRICAIPICSLTMTLCRSNTGRTQKLQNSTQIVAVQQKQHQPVSKDADKNL